eukprot:scaffold4212_cov122-Isochrysis_galbana.AAC.23
MQGRRPALTGARAATIARPAAKPNAASLNRQPPLKRKPSGVIGSLATETVEVAGALATMTVCGIRLPPPHPPAAPALLPPQRF